MYRYTVEDNSRLSDTTNLLTVRHGGNGSPLLYQPGQYAAIGFKNNFRPTPVRCFSICSSPEEQDKLQFSIRIKGRYTSAVKNLKPGDEVFVRGPYGGFVMNTHIDSDVVFFAGGIGIAPFMGMMEHATNLGLQNNIHLVYSCQTQNDIPFLQKLIELKNRNNKLKVSYIIGEEPATILVGQQVLFGRVDGAMMDKLGLNFDTQKFFMCGPPPYMKSILNLLKERQVPSDMIITEAFGQGSNRQTGAIRSWPFNIYAMTSLGLIIGGFVIMSLDLAKTIPTLENSATITASDNNDVIIKANGSNQKTAINSVKPTVDTNTKQDPIVTNSSTPSQTTKPTSKSPTTTTTPTPVAKPAPKPVSKVS